MAEPTPAPKKKASMAALAACIAVVLSVIGALGYWIHLEHQPQDFQRIEASPPPTPPPVPAPAKTSAATTSNKTVAKEPEQSDRAVDDWRYRRIGDLYLGPDGCRDCHRVRYEAGTQTAHFRDSAPAGRDTVLGHFEAGRNVLRTLDPSLTFEMEARDGRFWQTEVRTKDGQRKVVQTERFEVVVGSGVKGQTYLYLKDGAFFQLPISHYTPLDAWTFSPSFKEGMDYFNRPILPRCLECHVTNVTPAAPGPPAVHDGPIAGGGEMILGITCEKCHGPGAAHALYHRDHPKETQGRLMVPLKGLSRVRQMETCGFCHSGATLKKPLRPAFTWRPGRPLSDFFVDVRPETPGPPEVHGNQVALVQASACYQKSEALTCTTCHDVHKNERGQPALHSKRCLSCHQADHCGKAKELGPAAAENCIDCHMPVQESQGAHIWHGGKENYIPFRSHWIKVYQKESEAFIEKLKKK